MPTALKWSLNSLRRRTFRMASAVIGVVLGVFLAFEVLQVAVVVPAALGAQLQGFYGRATVTVNAPNTALSLPAHTVAAIARVPGVQAMLPLDVQIAVVGRAKHAMQLTILGVGRTFGGFERIFSPSGRAIDVSGQGLILSASEARTLGVRVGGRVHLVVNGRSVQATVRGIGRSEGALMPLLGRHYAIAWRGEVGAWLGQPPITDAVWILTRPGADVSRVASRIQQEVGGLFSVAVVADEQIGIPNNVNIILEVLTFLAALIFILAGIMIFYSMQVTVAEQVGEFATLRAIGATKGRILRMVLLQSFLVGATGVVLGLVLGVALQQPVLQAIGQYGAQGGAAGPLTATSLVVPACIALTTVLLAAYAPARRATRLEIARILSNSHGPLVASARDRIPLVTTLLTAIGLIASLVLAVIGRWTAADGCLVVTLFVFYRPLLWVSTRILTAVSNRFGLGRLKIASRSVGRRVPAAASIGALIGVAIVVYLSTGGIDSGVGHTLRADAQSYLGGAVSLTVASNRGVSESAINRLGDVSGVYEQQSAAFDLQTSGTSAPVTVEGMQLPAAGPLMSYRLTGVSWPQAMRQLQADPRDVVVAQPLMSQFGWRVGQAIRLPTTHGVGVYHVIGALPAQPVGENDTILMSLRAFASSYASPVRTYDVILSSLGATAAASHSLERIARGDHPSIVTVAGAIASESRQLGPVYAVFTSLSVFVALIALLGLANQQTMNVAARVQESAVMRAIGAATGWMTQVQFLELLIVTTLACWLGLLEAAVVARLLGRVITAAGFPIDLLLSPVAVAIAAVGVPVVIAGCGALSIGAAFRRLRIAEAIRYE